MTPTHWAWLLGGIALLALFQRSAHTLCTAAFDAVLHVFDALRTWLIDTALALRTTRSRLLEDVALGGGRMRTTFVIGQAMCAGAALLLVLCESTMVIYAMESLFGESLSAHLPPLLRSLQSVFTGGLLCAGLFAAWSFKAMATDSRTRLIVSDWYAPSARRLLRSCAGTAAVAVLVSVIGLAVVRSAALDEAERVETLQEPAPQDDARAEQTASVTYEQVLHAARWVVGVSSALAFLLAGVPAFAFAVDGLQLAPPVFVTVALGVLALIRWAAAIVAGIISGLRHLVTLVLQAVAWIGNPLARAIVELFRRLHRWADESPDSRGAERTCRGLVASLTALGDDLQLPDAAERPWAPAPSRQPRSLAQRQSVA